jgi:DNA-binding transcriptional regulator YiaG
MKITTEHPSSSYGIPVMLDDKNWPLDYADGVKLFRETMGWTREELALATGSSMRTVQGWEYGRPPSGPAIILMGILLERKKD